MRGLWYSMRPFSSFLAVFFRIDVFFSGFLHEGGPFFPEVWYTLPEPPFLFFLPE